MSQIQVASSAAAKPKTRPRKAVSAHPKFLDMVTNAIGTLKDRNGSSRQAICKAILGKYPSVNPNTMNSHVRNALKKGLETGALTRPARSQSANGATGRFKLGAVKPARPAKKKAAKPKKPAKKRPAKKAGVKKAAKPKGKSPRKKNTAGKKKAAGKKSTKTAKPKKKAKPATKTGVAKKPRAKKSPKKPTKK